MMRRKSREKRKRGLALVLAVSLAAVASGCGQEPGQERTENIELLEPVGVAAGYEAAARRNLYDVDVYPALVCPYVEEYSPGSSFAFDGYDAYPGEPVKRGDILLHGDTEDIDKQIEELEKEIARDEKSYREFVEETEESLVEPRAGKQNFQNDVDRLERSRPEQYILKEAEDGTVSETVNPAYEKWEQDNGYNYSLYMRWLQEASQKVIEGEESLRQRKELYEMDRGYKLTRLKFLREDKGALTLTAGMEGQVAAIRMLYEGDWVAAKEPLMAVGDTARPVLRCDYVNKTAVSKAQDVYAIVGGKRYETEYQPMEPEEYKRLSEENDKVYSTFYFAEGAEDIGMGAFGVIVVLHESRENVVTVPKSAIVKEEGASFVYVQEGDRNVYTPVQTGMSDGVYTEILSGVQEGDRVRAEETLAGAAGGSGSTVRLERGSVKGSFQSNGLLFYPSASWVTNPVKYGTCYYVERCASLYQQVKKGDVLARVRVVPDQLELDRNVRSLQREQERLADLRAGGEEQNRKAIEAKLESIAEIEKLIGDMKADFAVKEIKAPADGIITDIGYYEEDDLIQRGDKLFQVSDGNTDYIAIEDENGILTYGNEVSVGYDAGGGQTYTFVGKVVSLNAMSLSKSLTSDVTLVAIPPEAVGETAGSSQDDSGWWSRIWYSVSADVRVMDNVLLIPKKAVIEKSGVTYVRVLQEDGEVRLQSFIAGGSDSSNYWVAEGLTEGMEICLE